MTELIFALDQSSILQTLRADKPWLWLNPSLGSNPDKRLSMADILDAEVRLQRFAPLLQTLFPELSASNGLIESELLRAPAMQAELLEGNQPLSGQLWIKADHALPVAGSIKARGGIY